MKSKLSKLMSVAALALAASVPGVAAAQSTWNLGSSACGSGSGTTYATLTCTGSSSTETATMTAWGTQTTGGNFIAGTLANWDPNGFGAYVGSEVHSSPYHAFDSIPASGSTASTTEAMLISFGPVKVSLASIAVGWVSGDADVSILRWDGAGAPPALTGLGTGGLVGAGWTLVGSEDLDAAGKNFDNPNVVGTTLDAYKSTINLGTLVSSYWMISTYYGATSGNLDKKNDAFKILNFSANICASGVYTGGNGGNGGTCGSSGGGGSAPEPGSLALAGLALAIVYRSRKKALAG